MTATLPTHVDSLRRRGLSLLELVVVLAAVAVVAMAGLPAVTGVVESARELDTRRELARLEIAFTAYFEDTHSFPASFQDLVMDVSHAPGWSGPYLQALGARSVGASLSLIRDAWDAPYHVAIHDAVSLTLTSRGPDGRLGSADDLLLALDMSPVLRQDTRDELALLHVAIASYNRRYLPDQPLPHEIGALLERLRASGCLPSGLDGLDTDAWGDVYRPEPPGQDPVVRLVSSHFAPLDP